MTPTEYEQHLNERINQIVAAAADRAARYFRSRTPSHRRKTRRAVSIRLNGHSATVGLRFDRDYDMTDTPTHRRFARQWHELRPRLRALMITELNKALQGN